MKVAVITTAYPLTNEDMSGAFVAQMLHHLPADIYTTVVTPCAAQEFSSPDTELLRVRCFRYAPRRWQTLAHTPGGLPAALRRGGGAWLLLGLFLPALFLASLRAVRSADLVHANWSATGVIAGLAARLYGKPAITTLRGSDIAMAESNALFRKILHLCLRLNHRVVAVGEGLRGRAARLLGVGADRIAVIPNGIAKNFFALPPPTPKPSIRLLAVGALVPIKGLGTLISALARLPPEPRVELTLVGEGPERARIEAQVAALGLTNRVQLRGALAPPDIPRVLATHDVFVLASRAEGRPNALIEAMAAARAVVATDIPGVREVAVDGRNALLFPPNDIDALAARLRTLIEAPAMIPELGVRARATVADLDWAVTGRRYADLFRDVLAEQHR